MITYMGTIYYEERKTFVLRSMSYNSVQKLKG